MTPTPLVTSYTTPFYRRFGFGTLRNSSALELLAYTATGMIHFGIPCASMFIQAYDVPWHPASEALCLDCFSSVIPSWIGSENSLLTTREKFQLSHTQKLSVFFVFFLSATLYLSVHEIVSWCQMCRLLYTSDSANFLLEIQATYLSMFITLTFGMCTQNLELRGMEPATKFL